MPYTVTTAMVRSGPTRAGLPARFRMPVDREDSDPFTACSVLFRVVHFAAKRGRGIPLDMGARYRTVFHIHVAVC